MKFSHELLINLPRAEMIPLMDSWENLYFWMEGLQSHEHLSGEAGKTGAVTKMMFKIRGRDVEMTETVIRHDFPDCFDADYRSPGIFSSVKNHFEIVNEKCTRWTQDCDFQCTGFMRVILFLMPRAIRRQSHKPMQDFKKFAESRSTT